MRLQTAATFFFIFIPAGNSITEIVFIKLVLCLTKQKKQLKITAKTEAPSMPDVNRLFFFQETIVSKWKRNGVCENPCLYVLKVFVAIWRHFKL